MVFKVTKRRVHINSQNPLPSPPRPPAYLVVAFGSETQHLFLVLYLRDRRAFQDLPRFLQPALVPILPDKMGWQSKRIH
ncbi:hypothetical protein GQ457_12G009010 [Hibiscus cannabinus]